MDITIKHMDNLFAVNAQKSATLSLNPVGEMYKRQVGIANKGDHLQAALIDVYPFMGQQNRMEVLDFLSMRGDPQQNIKTIINNLPIYIIVGHSSLDLNLYEDVKKQGKGTE